MDNPHVNIFLIEPFDEEKYKKIIIYSDNEKNARAFASSKYYLIDKNFDKNSSSQGSVYLDENLSYFRAIEPKIISINPDSDSVNIEYRFVKYQLNKNEPQALIENVLV